MTADEMKKMPLEKLELFLGATDIVSEFKLIFPTKWIYKILYPVLVASSGVVSDVDNKVFCIRVL